MPMFDASLETAPGPRMHMFTHVPLGSCLHVHNFLTPHLLSAQQVACESISEPAFPIEL